MAYGIEFENYLQEARGTVEYDGFESEPNLTCDACKKEICDGCSRLDSFNDYCSWFNDNDNIIEYKSNKYKKFETVMKFVNNIVSKYKESDNLLFHSYPENYGSCGMHVHISPPSYSLYKLLTQQTIIFQPLFKNSPRQSGNVLSYRHKEAHYAILEYIRTNQEYYDNVIPRCAVTRNVHGTIEFRYNDFPKSQNQLALIYYLEQISRKLMKTRNLNFFNDLGFKANFRNIHSLNDLNKSLCMDPKNREFFTYLDEESFNDYINSSFVDNMKLWAKKISKKFTDLEVYSFYNHKMTSFNEFISSSFDYEIKIFNKFFDEKWNTTKWSDYWKARFVTGIPEQIIKI